ncbi:hypothetical protein A2U01_0028603, partial [Trifolium medium]|nr:hypothetical protein [Trifolium medium]
DDEMKWLVIEWVDDEMKWMVIEWVVK